MSTVAPPAPSLLLVVTLPDTLPVEVESEVGDGVGVIVVLEDVLGEASVKPPLFVPIWLTLGVNVGLWFVLCVVLLTCGGDRVAFTEGFAVGEELPPRQPLIDIKK